MPIYRYRAMTQNGMIVTNTIEESSKQLAIMKLKRNNLIPINVDKSLQRTKSKRTVRKNTHGIDEVLKNVDTANLLANRQNTKQSYFDKIYHSIMKSDKIRMRDIIVFTQNFYL